MSMPLLTWLCVACASPTPQGAVRWTFELAREPELELRVVLECEGDADGRTALGVTEGWGGVQEAGQALKGVRASATSGEALAVEHPSVSRWEIAHAPGAALRVEYAIPASAGARDLHSRAHYRPVLNERGMHLIGELALLRPEELDQEAVRSLRIAWIGFDEAGWEVAHSFGRGTEDLALELPLRDVRQALFLAGEIELLERSVRGGPLTVSLFGAKWGFDAEHLADVAARVVDLEREFFSEPAHPGYLISLLPVGSPERNELSLGGTGLERAFATFAPPGLRLGEGASSELRFVQLLLHEMFHEWNGRTIGLQAPEEELYWFSEGFTSFYARRLALRGGWIDAEAYARELSEVLRDHALSPARSASASDLAQRFWSDRDAQRMPYLRGDLLACLVDHAIRAKSGGERSLDDLMRELVDEARAQPRRRLALSRDALLERIAHWAGEEASARVRAVAVDGAPLELACEAFAPALALEPCEITSYVLGFDLERTQREKAIRGLVPGSPAAQAGLQEGERLSGAAIWPGDAEREVELQVGPQGSERRVVFLPRGAPVAGQRAVVRDAAAARGVL
jgi:predicted metalloprotease with PDZ domain